MQTHFGMHPSALTDTIVCPKCGMCGVINWDLIKTGNGVRKDFANLSGNFYERLASKPPYQIEIVCNECDVPVPQARFQLEA